MNRRHFLALGAATLALPQLAGAEPLDYVEGLVEDRLAKGETLFVDFKADWCGTCARQERVINALRAADPAYDASVTFVQVNWDKHSNGFLAQSLNIPRRSTLVVLKGDQELGRIVAGTAESEIKALMDVAVSAAGSS